jgi:hypothetical protein
MMPMKRLQPHPSAALPATDISSHAETNRHAMTKVSAALDELEFGVITITVHAAKIVQIDVTERHRFTS